MVLPAWFKLKAMFEPDEMEFVAKCEGNYIYVEGGTPRFPFTLWNLFHRVRARMQTTSNCGERFHKVQKGRYYKNGHPAVPCWLSNLKRDQNDACGRLGQSARGAGRAPTRTYLEKITTVERLIGQLMMTNDTEDFLIKIANARLFWKDSRDYDVTIPEVVAVVQPIQALQLQAPADPSVAPELVNAEIAIAPSIVHAVPALQLQALTDLSVLPESGAAEIAVAPSVAPEVLDEATRWSPISPTQPFAEGLPSQDHLDNIFEEDAFAAVPAPARILRPRSARIVVQSREGGLGLLRVRGRRPRRIVVASAPPLLRPPTDPAVLVRLCSAYYSAQIHGPHFPIEGVCRYRKTRATHPYQDTAAWSISVAKNGKKTCCLGCNQFNREGDQSPAVGDQLPRRWCQI